MKVLFVCTGNTCRSPMAQALAKAMHPEWETRSRGVAVYGALPASAEARAVMAGRGLTLDGHLSAPVGREDLLWADAVYGVTEGHVRWLEERYPELAGRKIRPLPGPGIGDPHGRGEAAYRACADALEEAIRSI